MLGVAILVLFGSVAVTVGTILLARWIVSLVEPNDEAVETRLPDNFAGSDLERCIENQPGTIAWFKKTLPDLSNEKVFGKRILLRELDQPEPLAKMAESIRSLHGLFRTGRRESEDIAPLLFALADGDEGWCAVPHRMLYAAWRDSIEQPIDDEVAQAITMAATNAARHATISYVTVTEAGTVRAESNDGWFNRAVSHLIENGFVTILQITNGGEDYLAPTAKLYEAAQDPNNRF